MNNKLITALRTAAKAVETRTFHYDWNLTSQCNCGVVFCALTGSSSKELIQRIPKAPAADGISTWTDRVGFYCPVAGIPTQALFKELFSYGLTAQEMVELEYLSNPEILARSGIEHEIVTPEKRITVRQFIYFGKERSVITSPRKVTKVENYFTDSNNLVKYLRAWADILVERGTVQPEPVTELRAVTVTAV